MTDIVSLLDGVRDNGHGKYMARCPAHEDRSPSLSVKVCDDGRTLIHCFAGCDAEAVVMSLGLTLADLMPEQPAGHNVRPIRSRMPIADGLQALDHESLVVAIIARDMLDHKAIDLPTWQRLKQAVIRIGTTRDACIPARYRP